MFNWGTGTNRKLFPDQLSSNHPSIHSWCAGGCCVTLAERKRLYCVCVSRSGCNASTEGKGDERPIFAAPSLIRANDSVSHVSPLQIIDPLPALGPGFSLLGSRNKQAKSFGVLVFRCRGLICGVRVSLLDHPCYWFLDLCFPRWVLVVESMGWRKLVGDWLTELRGRGG
jgi:hypothetical protein